LQKRWRIVVSVCLSIVYNKLDDSQLFAEERDVWEQIMLYQEVDLVFGPACSSSTLHRSTGRCRQSRATIWRLHIMSADWNAIQCDTFNAR